MLFRSRYPLQVLSRVAGRAAQLATSRASRSSPSVPGSSHGSTVPRLGILFEERTAGGELGQEVTGVLIRLFPDVPRRVRVLRGAAMRRLQALSPCGGRSSSGCKRLSPTGEDPLHDETPFPPRGKTLCTMQTPFPRGGRPGTRSRCSSPATKTGGTCRKPAALRHEALRETSIRRPASGETALSASSPSW